VRLAVCNFTGDLNNDFLVLDTKTGEVLYGSTQAAASEAAW